MSPDDVVMRLGAPDSRTEEDEDGDRVFVYDKLGLELTFARSDGDRLSIAEVLKPSGFCISGRALPNREEELVAVLRAAGVDLGRAPAVVDEPDCWRVYECADTSITAFFTKDRDLQNLSLGPRLDLRTQEVRWPWLEPMVIFGDGYATQYPYRAPSARPETSAHSRFRRRDARLGGALDGSGAYTPNHFILSLGVTEATDDTTGPHGLIQELDPVFVHEYLHYWHNISTFSGLYFMTFHQWVAALFSKTLEARGDGKSDGRLSTDDADHLLGLTRLRDRMEGEAAPRGVGDEDEGDGWRVVDLQTIAEKIPLQKGADAAPADTVRVLLQNARGDEAELLLGSLAIEESVVGILERQVYRFHGCDPDPLPQFPYGVVESIAEYVVGDQLPTDEVERERALATLGTLALLVPQHSRNLIGFMKLYRERRERDGESALESLVMTIQSDFVELSGALRKQVGEFVKMHDGRGAVGSLLPVLEGEVLRALADRCSSLLVDLDLFYPSFSPDALRKHMNRFLPCDVLMERDLSSRDSERPEVDELYTFWSEKPELDPGVAVSDGFRALQAQQTYVLSHVTAGGDGFVRSEDVEAKCPFYTSCNLKPRVKKPKVCAERPWEHFQPSGKLCWYASGVMATLGTAKVTGLANGADDGDESG